MSAHLEWSALSLLVLGLGAAAASGYLTMVHYADAPLVCSGGGVVDCAAVTQSSYSVIPGTAIPVTVPGLVWSAVSIGLAFRALVGGLRGTPEPAWLSPALVAWALAGVMPVLYLIYAEAVRLHRLCEWCTAVHVAVVASLLVALLRLQRSWVGD